MNLSDLRRKLASALFNVRKIDDKNSDLDRAISRTIRDVSSLSSDQYRSIIDTVRELQSRMESINNISPNTDIYKKISDIFTMNAGSAVVSKDRINRYNMYEGIVEAIPFVKKALWILTLNIISPEDISKVAIKYETSRSSLKENTEFKIVTEQFKNIADVLKINDKLEDIIMEVLELGDSFVEIRVADESLKRLLRKYQVKTVKENLTFDINLYSYDSSLTQNIAGKALNVLEDLTPLASTLNDKNYELNQIELIQLDPRRVVKLQTKEAFFGYVVVNTNENTEVSNSLSNAYSRMGNNSKLEFDLQSVVTQLANQILNILRQSNGLKIDDPQIKKNIASVLSMNQKLNFSTVDIRYIPPNRMVHFAFSTKKFFPYGESWLLGSELDARLYLTDKVATVVHRVARSGDRQVIYVETGVDPDTRRYIEEVKRQLIKKEVAWNEIDINSIPSALTPFERIYLPRRRGQEFVSFDSINLGSMPDKMETNTELKKSLLHALGVPPSYLGVEEYVESKATLAQENALFARTIIGLQKKFSECLTELFQRVYEITYTNTKEYSSYYKDVIVTFSAPQSILLENVNNIYNSVSNMANTLADFGVPKKLIAKKFITDIDWDEIEKSEALEKQNQEEV